MKATMGEDGRNHFRLDVEKQGINVDVKTHKNEHIQGILKDVSNGGIAFMLHETPKYHVIGEHIEVSFVIEERTFQFELRILRKFTKNDITYYAGKFIISSKIKQSQLSLLLMKMKLMTNN